ncbi:MAG: DUF2147 domain-containing protein [Janthinobacterium lividum]
MRKICIAAVLLLAASAAFAQSTPVGLWKTIDDDSGQEKSLVRISSADGQLIGKVDKLLDPGQQAILCQHCSGERENKPVLGLQIIDGVRQDGDTWGGGQILDPKNGKLYKVRLKPVDNGRKLEVRGYIGPFFRTQTWVRVE